jgi:GTP 3',8-cyclase
LRAIMRDRNDADEADEDVHMDDRLAAEIERAVGTKWAGHHIGQVNFVRPSRSMSQIGG